MDNYRDLQKYYPTLVSNIHGKRDDDESIERVERINILPEKIKELLYSNEIVDFIYSVEQRFGLSDIQTEEFSRMVRRYFFRELKEEKFIEFITQACRTSPTEAVKILKSIHVISPQNSEGEEVRRDLIYMSLSQILQQYPGSKDQEITTKKITTKPFLQPVKPTVKNWIMVYEKALDVTKHNAIERGEFIFRSEATRGLNSEEKNTLSAVLKSRDEDSELAFDRMSKEIVFGIERREKKDNVQRNAPNTREQKPVQLVNEVDQVNNEKAISAQMVDQKEDAIEKATNELEAFIDVMQDRSQIQKQQVKKSPQKIVQKNIPSVQRPQMQITPEMHSEIQKNRSELKQGGSELKEVIQKKEMQEKPVIKNTQKKNQKKQDKNKIAFSSNHNLPSEKSQKKTLRATRNFLNIKPMGKLHETTKEVEKTKKKKEL